MEYQVRNAPGASLAHSAKAQTGEEDLEIDAQEVSEHKVRERHHPLLGTSNFKSGNACVLPLYTSVIKMYCKQQVSTLCVLAGAAIQPIWAGPADLLGATAGAHECAHCYCHVCLQLQATAHTRGVSPSL